MITALDGRHISTDRKLNMNIPALRSALRSPYGWLMVLVTAAYVTASIVTGGSVLGTAIYGVVFGSFTLVTFGLRYTAWIEDANRALRNAETDARMKAQEAEHQAYLDNLDAKRAEREELRAQQQRDDILAGRRCPAWCDDCDEEQREADRKTAEFLAERAVRHGHPSASDVEVLEHVTRAA